MERRPDPIADVLPYFIKSEDHLAGSNEFHGAGGDLRVEQLTGELHGAIVDGTSAPQGSKQPAKLAGASAGRSR
jgi:hypothetical protein